MPNLEEIISRAAQLAEGTASDAFQSVVADAGFTYETLFPHVARYAARRISAKGGAARDLSQSVTIDITNGSGEVPEYVIEESLEDARLENYPIAALVPYSDFARSRFNSAFPYFAFSAGNIYFTNGSDGAEEPFTGVLVLRTSVIPQLPEIITEAIPMSVNTGEQIILTLAAVMRGEIPLMQLVNQ